MPLFLSVRLKVASLMSIINQSARVDSKIGQYMLNGAEVQASHCLLGWALRNYYATGNKW